MKIINLNQIKKLFNANEAIGAVENAFILYSTRKTISPPAFVFNLPNNNGEICVKTAILPKLPTYTIKLVSVFKSNNKMGIPTLLGNMMVFNTKTGKLFALLKENGWLTGQRTACAGAIADKYFSQKSARFLGVIGAGKQAEFQTQMILSQSKKYKTVVIWNRTKAKAKLFLKKLKKNFPNKKYILVKTLNKLVKYSNTIITTTASTKPLIKKGMLINNGLTIIGIGADMPDKCELDPLLLNKMDKIFVDSLQSNLVLGDISKAIKNKSITLKNITGEIGQVINKNKAGRKNDQEKIVVKLVGIGVQDTVIGNYIYQKCIKIS